MLLRKFSHDISYKLWDLEEDSHFTARLIKIEQYKSMTNKIVDMATFEVVCPGNSLLLEKGEWIELDQLDFDHSIRVEA